MVEASRQWQMVSKREMFRERFGRVANGCGF